jgi:hypothetical protein
MNENYFHCNVLIDNFRQNLIFSKCFRRIQSVSSLNLYKKLGEWVRTKVECGLELIPSLEIGIAEINWLKSSSLTSTSYPGSFFGKDPGSGWSRGSHFLGAKLTFVAL